VDPAAVLALCHEHAAAEARFDVDRILATLAPVPRYEFFPAGRRLEGWGVVERFYREQYPRFAGRVTHYGLLGEWTNEHAAVQEYTIAVGDGEEPGGAYRVVSMMPVDEVSGKLSGERLFCHEGFMRALLGPLLALSVPIEGF